jgi:Putative peptidoglycan binding domain
MNAGDSEPPRDPDDWFDEPQPVPPRRPRRPPVQADPDAQTREHPAAMPEDDWLAPESLTRKPRPARMPPIAGRRMLAGLGIALALLLIGLALGGVFSGTGKKKANAPLTTESAPTTALTQTQTVALPAATLKLGDHGNAVEQLQRALSSLGYTAGTIDGVFGASTERALVAFQTAHHLSPDGVLGPATRAALLNALGPG